MSLAYKLLASLVSLSHIKKIFTLDKDLILAYARRKERKNKFNFEKIKRKAKFSKCELIEIASYPCIVFKKDEAFSNKAILYFYGGGMITGPDNMDFKLADLLVKKTGKDVFFPLYPLCIDRSILYTYKFSFEVYKYMLSTYKASDINVLGFSSGAVISLGIFLYNNERKSPMPMPKRIIAVSPGGLPNLEEVEDREIMSKLEEFSKTDILIDAKYFKTAREILINNEEVPEYMLNSHKGNFKNFSETYFYYGSKECLYAYEPYFRRAFNNYKAIYKLKVGEGMCHCYPLLRFFKEGKRAQDEIIELLK